MVATTTTASVRLQREMVKVPAMGQRSTATARVRMSTRRAGRLRRAGGKLVQETVHDRLYAKPDRIGRRQIVGAGEALERGPRVVLTERLRVDGDSNRADGRIRQAAAA